MRLEVGGICVEVVRRRWQKTLRVSVRIGTGDVRVSAPSWMPDYDIVRFVESKMSWIEKHVERAKEQAKAAPLELQYVSGERHKLWGKPYRLAVFEPGPDSMGGVRPPEPDSIGAVPSPSPSSVGGEPPPGADSAGVEPSPGAGSNPFKIRVRDGRTVAAITIWASDGAIVMDARAPAPGTTRAQREAAMRAWYGSETLRAAKPFAARWERELGVRASEVRARDMRTRWGSCSGALKRVWLSSRLAMMPPECLDYVVLHELAHLLVMDHGSRFTALLDRHMPDWRERKATLNAQRGRAQTEK